MLKKLFCAFFFGVDTVQTVPKHVWIDRFAMILALFLGDLIRRHIDIFRNNQFFRGINIPECDKMVSDLIHTR